MTKSTAPKSPPRVSVRVAFAALLLAWVAGIDAPAAIAQSEASDAVDVKSAFFESQDDSSTPNSDSDAESVAATAAYTEETGDVWNQVVDLQARMQRQEREIARLRKNSRSGTRSSSRSSNDSPWFFTYESVLLQPTQDNASAIIVETDDGYSTVSFPWEVEHSPRIQFGRESSSDALGWRFRFWQFRHGQSLAAGNANGLIPTGNEGTVGYLSEDGDITTGLQFIEEGEFRSTIRTDVLDWEFQREIFEPIDIYAGVRYAKVAQKYAANTDQGSAAGRSQFRGIGPTVAMRFTHVLPVETVSLFANLRGSMLFGNKDFSAVDDVNNMLQTVGVIDTRSASDGVDAMVTNGELQLGIRWAPSPFFATSIAVEGQRFNNVGGPNPVAVFTGPDGGISTDSPMDDGLSLIGLAVSAELAW